jgi:hypothetical protein
MGDVSEGVGDGDRAGAGAGGGLTATAAGVGPEAASAPPFASPLIFSTIDSSRLARVLFLTSSPHFWMRSSKS